MSQYKSLTSVININDIVRTLEEDLVRRENETLIAENTLIKNSVLEVVKKYFS
jgi:hypothetical protein